MAKRKSRGPKPHKFRNKLLLNQWLVSLFGIDPLPDFRAEVGLMILHDALLPYPPVRPNANAQAARASSGDPTTNCTASPAAGNPRRSPSNSSLPIFPHTSNGFRASMR